ncbi:hypothetical protein HXT04_00165 [Treponema parvum]|nr:hypothetical protein HXT04_00165 [Treponema parvum]
MILLNLISCFSREITVKGDGNPALGKYIKGEITDLTRKDDKYYYPEFEIKIKKITKYRISEYEIYYVYVFGQNANVLLSVRKLYTEKDEEIRELNDNGFFVIYRKLEKVPLETILDASSYMGILNYTSVDAMNCKVRINTSK